MMHNFGPRVAKGDEISATSLNPTMKRIIPALALGLALATSLLATPIVPTSYSYNVGFGPSGSYPDETGGQLTDGLYNAIIPGSNLGTPNAVNWVGFDNYRGGSFTFNFANSVTIDSVSLSMVRWNPAGVYLPASVTVGSTNFSVNESSYTDMDLALLTFGGSWTGTSLTVTIAAGGYWTFVDEVTFNQQTSTNTVPDSTGTLALMSLSVAALFAVRRRFAS